MNTFLVDALGWVGAILLLIAYGMISAQRVKSNSWLYQGLNLAGSAGLIINSTYYGAYPSTFVNVVWSGIAIFALISAGRRAEKSSA